MSKTKIKIKLIKILEKDKYQAKMIILIWRNKSLRKKQKFLKKRIQILHKANLTSYSPQMPK